MELISNLYENLFEVITEGLILVNEEGEIIKINRAGYEMFGYEEEELINQNIDTLVPEPARGTHKEQRDSYNRKPIKRPMGANVKLVGLKKDSTVFPVQISLNPFVDQNGRKFVVALISDVTERRENEDKLHRLKESLEQNVRDRTKELRESEQLYKSIARNFPSGVISIFDREYRYEFAEGKGLFEMGIESADLIGIRYLDRIDASASEKVKKELDEAFKGNTRSFEVKVGSRTYQINAVPLSVDAGRVDRILVVEQNITKQKEINQKLEENLNKERELTEMKSRFVSMASHEFRTPLTTINSSASLIRKHMEKGNYDRVEAHVEKIKKSVHNLTSILNDFLSFEKLEANQVRVKKIDVDIPALLAETFNEMIDIAKGNQTIRYEGPKELVISIDELMLKNMVLNLLSNAVKYSHIDGKVIVGLEDNGDSVQLMFKDHGVGIPLEDQKNLFSRFFRAGNVTNIEGTGLGLNIVVRYLDLLKGEISFISKEREGTTFFVTLPKE